MDMHTFSTLELAEKTIGRFKRAALLVSFGKDSMAMLHLLRHLNLDVICHRPPFDAKKWQFADEIIRRWNLRVYDWAPHQMALQKRGDGVELISIYNLGNQGASFAIGQKIEQQATDDPRLLVCGLNDCIRRPRGTIEHVWDLLLCAQKDGDDGHRLNNISVGSDLKQAFNSPTVYAPLADWTEEQVWEYIKVYDVPTSPAYLPDHSKRSIDDPDVVRGCFACITSTEKTVACPRLFGQTINTITDQVPMMAATEEF